MDGRLEGGITSSVLIMGVLVMSGFDANISLKRAFAGVAFTTDAPKELLPGFLTSKSLC